MRLTGGQVKLVQCGEKEAEAKGKAVNLLVNLSFFYGHDQKDKIPDTAEMSFVRRLPGLGQGEELNNPAVTQNREQLR